MPTTRKLIHLSLIAVVFIWHAPLHKLAAQEKVTSSQSIVSKEIRPVSVLLTQDGTLAGSALAINGKPAIGQTVVLGKKGKPIAKSVVDSTGKFQFKKLKPGNYQIATGEAAAFVNCHSPQNAPAQCLKQIILSRDAMIARGQQPASVLLHPLMIGLVVAAAVVIPIAVSNNKDDAS